MKSMAWVLLLLGGCSMRATTDQILDTTSNAKALLPVLHETAKPFLY